MGKVATPVAIVAGVGAGIFALASLPKLLDNERSKKLKAELERQATAGGDTALAAAHLSLRPEARDRVGSIAGPWPFKVEKCQATQDVMLGAHPPAALNLSCPSRSPKWDSLPA